METDDKTAEDGTENGMGADAVFAKMKAEGFQGTQKEYLFAMVGKKMRELNEREYIIEN